LRALTPALFLHLEIEVGGVFADSVASKPAFSVMTLFVVFNLAGEAFCNMVDTWFSGTFLQSLRCFKSLVLDGRMPAMWLVGPDGAGICGTQYQYTHRKEQSLDGSLIGGTLDSIVYSFKANIRE
jgi:hypothetical protein